MNVGSVKAQAERRLIVLAVHDRHCINIHAGFTHIYVHVFANMPSWISGGVHMYMLIALMNNKTVKLYDYIIATHPFQVLAQCVGTLINFTVKCNALGILLLNHLMGKSFCRFYCNIFN